MNKQQLIERCVAHIREAPNTEDASDYTLEAIELAQELAASEESTGAFQEVFPVDMSRAVIASSGAGDWGVVLWYQGPDLEREIEEVGQGLQIDALGLFDAPTGLSVWEGRYLSAGADIETDGSYRELTDQEWSAVREGSSPWE